MNETLSFAGWRPGNPDQIIPWKEKFDEEYSDGGQLTLLSKEIYQAEADEDMPLSNIAILLKQWICRRLDQIRRQFVSAYICVHYINTGNQNH